MKAAFLSLLVLLGAMPLHAGDRPSFELTTLMGETYHGCRIIKVTPAGLTITYDSGVAKVPFELLGDAWKDLYHYDPEKARVYEEHEEAKRQEAEARRKEQLAALEKQKNQQMTELMKTEHQREEFEAKLAREQAEAAARARQTPPLAPYPPDGTVPQVPPISQVYTPGQTDTTMGGGGPGYPPAYNTGLPYVYTPGYVYPPAYVVPFAPRFPLRPGMSRRPGPGMPVTH
jgi:hypothetical protein